VNSYRKSGAIFDGGGASGYIGSQIANVAGFTGGIKADGYGVSASYKLSPQFVLNAFGTYAKLDDFVTTADVWTYGLGIALPDFGKKGNLLGFVVGAEPHVTATSLGGSFTTPFHFEGFYKYQMNDRISITPGLIWITNPGQVNGANSAVIGTVRTTFTF
jgi:carbohydrate-selective porin OprB